MPESKNTTGALHITDLDLNISALRESAEQTKAVLEDISKTALSTKNSLNGIFDGVGGGSSNGGNDLKSNAKEQQEAVKVTITSLNNLIGKYADLQKKVDDFALSTTNLTQEYKDLRDGVNEAVSKLTSYTSSFDEKGNLPKEAKEIATAIAENAKALAKYTADYKLYVASLEQGNKSYDETIAKLVSLETNYTKLSTSFYKLGQSETSNGLRETADEIQKIINSIGNSKEVTEEQQKRVAELTAKLNEYSLTLAKIKGEQAKKPLELNSDKALAQIKSLTNGYSEFESKLSRSKLKSELLSGMADSAKKAREQLDNLSVSLKNTNTVDENTSRTIKTLKENLSKLTVELRDAETNARNTGEGFRDLNSNAKESGGIIADFLNKLADKAKWLLAFELINQARNLFGDMFTTMQETEDAVVELQRVLNDSSLTNESMAKELYEIAYEYGQTFDNVQETAVLFAQTGKSWTEVIDATRATMLALNTAELDTSQATTGLIAVMSQFKIQASELQEVIDKVNITADNFPVTSENIVAALQRAGSAAYNYGMTLEETIGIITALSEATGRSGENLGTSLNSLINFSMKESSLKAFSDYLGGISLAGKDVLEIWTLLSAAIKDGGESLAEMMASNEDFADLFSEEMAETVGALEEYNAAIGNAEDVYSSAGVYRKNYFIALLNNFDTAIEAIQNMNEAEGYSIAENEKYMETLTASLNQLQIVAKELVQQFAETGALDFAKNLVNIATTVLQLTKNLGGLRTALIAITSLLVSFKIGSIFNAFKVFEFNILNAIDKVWSFHAAITGATGVTVTFATVVQNAVPIIGTIVTVLAAVVGAIENYNAKVKEAREETLKLGSDAYQSALDLDKAYETYLTESAESTLKFNASTAEMLKMFGYVEEDIPYLEKKYGDLATAIKMLYEEMRQAKREQIKDAYDEAIASLARLETQVNVTESAIKEFYNLPQQLNMSFSYEDNVKSELTRQVTTVDEAREKLANLNEMRKEAEERLGKTKASENAYYKELERQIKALEEAIELIEKYGYDLDVLDGLIKGTSEATANLDGETEEIKNALKEISEAIEDVGTEFETASGKVDTFQSAYSTVATAVQEYNDKGYLSADNLQKLLELEPEYINLLEIKGEKLYINGEALDNLTQANEDYIKQATAAKIAEEALTLAEQYRKVSLGELTIEELNAQMATNLLTNDVAKAAYQFLQGKMSADEFASALANTADVAIIADNVITDYVNGVTNLAEKYKDVLGLFNQNKGYWQYIPSSGGNSSKTDNTEKEELQAQKKALQKQKEQQKDYYDNLTELKEKDKKASKEHYEELQEQVKKQKEISDEYYENEIDKLKETQEAQGRLNDALDYYANRQKTLRNLEQAQARSGIEWREKEIEYQESLNDLDKDWNDKLKDWAVDDQISELERLKEEAEKGYDTEIDHLKELQEQQEKVFEAEIENLKELKEAAVNAIEGEIDKIEEAIDAISDKVSASAAAGYWAWVDTSTKTSDEIKGQLGKAFDKVEEKSKETAETSFDYFNTLFLTPTKDALNEISEIAFMPQGGQLSFSNPDDRKKLKDIIDSVRANNATITPQIPKTETTYASKDKKTGEVKGSGVNNNTVNVYVNQVGGAADVDQLMVGLTNTLDGITRNKF